MSADTPTITPGEPLADVVRDDDGVIRIDVDAPGLETTVQVRTLDHTVIVDGHRLRERSGQYLLHERARTLHREFQLPRETDMRNVHARIYDGVLTILAHAGGGESEPGEHQVDVRPSTWACHPDAAAI